MAESLQTMPLPPPVTPAPPPEDDIETISAKLIGWAEDPWAFIQDAVWTLDEVDPRSPVKRFPTMVCIKCRRYAGGKMREDRFCVACGELLRPMVYLQKLTERWARGRPQVLAVPKARRMKISWLMVALHTWLAMFHAGAKVFFVSSKEGKSKELIERAEFILTQIPKAKISARAMPKWTRREEPPRIEFPGLMSSITGVPEGPDQLRQFTATAILADEIGTWKWPRASYAAMKPCIEGMEDTGGRITLVSTPYPGFWRSFVCGELTA